MCRILFVFVMCITASSHAVLDEAVAIWNPNSSIPRNLYMFGHYHDYGKRDDIEKDQTEHIVALINKKKEQKPLHVLIEQELTYGYENNSMLHRLPLLIEQSKMADVTCTNIEIRDVAIAACFVLQSKWPEIIGGHLQDSLSSKSYNLSEITCDDIYESFKRSKQYVVQRLNELDISPNIYKYHTRLSRIFLDAVLEDIDFKKGEKKTVVSVSERNDKQRCEKFINNLTSAFSPLFDLHIVCCVQEIPEADSDIAVVAGGAHVDAVAKILSELGMYEFHRYPDQNPDSSEQSYVPLDNQQLNIFELQPSIWLKGYHYAKQLYTGSWLCS